jgi:uncharacterized protein involved in response to NO
VPTQDGWRGRHLLDSPHRLGFFLAMLVLAASGLWWAAVQLERSAVLPPMPMAVTPSLVHGAVMTFGFFPLFFCGFLFTAGPRWLHVRGPSARGLLPALAAQAAGWLVWLAGSQVHRLLAVAGLALAASGLLRATMLFRRLVAASTDEDRIHPIAIVSALGFGVVCIGAVAVSLLLEADAVALRFVLSGLWGCVAVVFVTAGHRMIPFFDPAPGTWLARCSNRAPLALLVGITSFEAAAVWLPGAGLPPWWPLLRAGAELAVGTLLLWGAMAWSFAKPLRRHRLLRMMHTGVVWIALGFALQGGAALLGRATGTAWLPLASLHAFAMGGLGTLMLAMVTRVSAAHAGQPVAAENLVWSLFWVLQLATLLRIAATVPGAPTQPLLTAAALAWAGLMTAWGLRYGWGYGRPPATARRR